MQYADTQSSLPGWKQSKQVISWPVLTKHNIHKYYPDTIETPKGHMNQMHKNVQSTKQTAMETVNSKDMQGKKIQYVYLRVYDSRDTIFSNQTGQFPTCSKSGNKYIMVMVKIVSNAILAKPLKSQKDEELIQGYNGLLLWLQCAGIMPKKHVMDNEIFKKWRTIFVTSVSWLSN